MTACTVVDALSVVLVIFGTGCFVVASAVVVHRSRKTGRKS